MKFEWKNVNKKSWKPNKANRKVSWEIEENKNQENFKKQKNFSHQTWTRIRKRTRTSADLPMLVLRIQLAKSICWLAPLMRSSPFATQPTMNLWRCWYQVEATLHESRHSPFARVTANSGRYRAGEKKFVGERKKKENFSLLHVELISLVLQVEDVME